MNPLSRAWGDFSDTAQLVGGKPILLQSHSEPITCLVTYITEHCESRGPKSAGIVIVQDNYLDSDRHDGYMWEHLWLMWKPSQWPKSSPSESDWKSSWVTVWQPSQIEFQQQREGLTERPLLQLAPYWRFYSHGQEINGLWTLNYPLTLDAIPSGLTAGC